MEGSFWRTIPGLLTALAGVITAVTGLLLALPKVGLIGGEAAPAPAASIASSVAGARETAPPATDISGVWSATVTYSWGATHKERFALQGDGARVVGTATFLGSPRGVMGGTREGDTISFTVRGEELLGSERRDFELTYRGTLVNGGLHFMLEDSRGDPPIQFAAARELP
jgi:hypothetical protein